MPKISLFLDSGAFSALTQKVQINLTEYIAFIKKYQGIIDVYSVLDDITDPEITLANQKTMEEAGLNPVPCFHHGEPFDYLDNYVDNYDYISLGGLVGARTKVLQEWLDRCWLRLIEGNGMPKVKVHAFGMTSHQLLWRYPWYSVDSTTWILTARMGSIYVPRMQFGKYDYKLRPWIITFTKNALNGKLPEGKHFDTFGPANRQSILDYLAHRGYGLGHSEFCLVDNWEEHGLAVNERWVSPANGTQRRMEIVHEPGVTNSYQARGDLNIMYYMDLEAHFPPWPHKWQYRNKVRLGLF